MPNALKEAVVRVPSDWDGMVKVLENGSPAWIVQHFADVRLTLTVVVPMDQDALALDCPVVGLVLVTAHCGVIDAVFLLPILPIFEILVPGLLVALVLQFLVLGSAVMVVP